MKVDCLCLNEVHHSACPNHPDWEPVIDVGPGHICPNCHDDHSANRVCPEFLRLRELLGKAREQVGMYDNIFEKDGLALIEEIDEVLK